MHIPILFKGPDTDTLFTFHHTQNNQTFTINPEGIIQEAIFDPERWIITKDPIVLNVENIKLEQKIKVFPNPASDQLHVQILDLEGRYEIEIISLAGKRILYKKMVACNNVDIIDVSALPAGNYVLRISHGGSSFVERVVITK